MPRHKLIFRHAGIVSPGEHIHMLSGKGVDVVDLICPDCGEAIFIYYRTLGGDPNYEEPEEEGDEE